MFKRNHIMVPAALLIFAMTPSMSYAAEALSAGNSGEISGPAVSVTPVKTATFKESILVTGSLVPRRDVLISPEISGYRISEILAEHGDRVKKGQLLARLNDATLKAQLAQLQANNLRADASIEQARSRIAEAEASKSLADAAFERAKRLVKSGATSRSIYDDREAAAIRAAASLRSARDGLRVAEAEKAQVEAQIHEAELRLGYTQIKALADGIVSRRNAKLGAQTLAAGEALFRIIADGEIELDAEVPEIYLSRVKVGQRARIEIAGLKAREGVVRLLSPEVDPATRLGRVRIAIAEDDGLRIGSFARGVIDTGERNSLGIPASALLNRNEGTSVKVVKNGLVETRKVSVGMRSGRRAEIVDGLREGELVVTRSAMLLRDGDKVRAVAAKDTQSRSEVQ